MVHIFDTSCHFTIETKEIVSQNGTVPIHDFIFYHQDVLIKKINGKKI